MQIGIEILIIVLLLVVNGVLAGSEIAIVSARRVRLQQRAEAGDAGALEALALASEPNRFLSTVQIGITMIGILAGAFGGATLAQALAEVFEDSGVGPRYSEAIAVAIVVLAITYLSLIIGELLPKRISLQHPERVAGAIARPMRVLSAVMSPAVWFLGASTDALLAMLRVRPQAQQPISEEEIRMIVKESTLMGVFEPAEHEIIHAALRLGGLSVTDVMVPRRDVIWLDLNDSPEAIRSEISRSMHTRFPVCDGSLDAVVGIASIRDLWLQSEKGQALDLRPAMQPPLLLPEGINVLVALERFRQDRATLAVVIDEYGGTAGVLSVADILEEIVGELPAPGETDTEGILTRDDGTWLIDGWLPADRVAEALGLKELPEEGEYHTMAGFILLLMGHVPHEGESIDWAGFRFEVIDMDGQRIDKVLLSRISF